MIWKTILNSPVRLFGKNQEAALGFDEFGMPVNESKLISRLDLLDISLITAICSMHRLGIIIQGLLGLVQKI